jgi:Sulfotransferase domain
MNGGDARPGRLPNLLIAGVSKAGTGSLFAYLAQHPDVCASTEKETGYFNAVREEGGALPPIATYEAFFSHRRDEPYAMEATPSYCYGGPRVLEAIGEILERPRILISLRDPVDRLWSAYTFQRSLMHLPGIDSFEEYVSACEALRRRGTSLLDSGNLKGLAIGVYADYVGAWFDAFGDDVRAIFFEELTSDPGAVIADICRWLAIDDAVTASFDYAARNPTIHPRSMALGRAAFALRRTAGGVLERRPRIRTALRTAYYRLNGGRAPEVLTPDTRRRVQEIYRESNASLRNLLASRGYDRLPAWLSAG